MPTRVLPRKIPGPKPPVAPPVIPPVVPPPPLPDPEPEPVAVTKETPFREIPSITADRTCEILLSYPMASACRSIHAATGGRALPLAQSFKESQYGKTARGNNPLGLMELDGRTLKTFASWADAFAEWARRMDDPSYKPGMPGVYMPLGMTLERFIRVYVAGPGPGYANGETAASVALYLQQTVDRLNRYFGVAGQPSPPPPPTGAITLGRVPKPAGMQLRVVWNSTAWNDVGPRNPRGIVIHRMLGTLNGTDSYFRGEAAGRALTDFGVGAGSLGRVYQWNLLDGKRAPWASGPADGVKGDAVPFVNRYGVNAINRDCASVEIEGWQNDPVPAATWTALVELVAWLADDWLRVDYQTWPKNRDGVHALFHHREFTNQKECPFQWVIVNTPRLIADVRERLRQYQTGAA